MPVQPNDFITSAINIIKNGTEIDCRNAVSRAYYAAYHEADRVSQYSNGVSTKKGTHEKLSDKLKKHPGSTSKDKDIRKMGVLLEQCKKYRVEADYFIMNQFTIANAQAVVTQCQDIINLAKNIP